MRTHEKDRNAAQQDKLPQHDSDENVGEERNTDAPKRGELPSHPASSGNSEDEETSLEFMRERDSDYVVDDLNEGDGIPIENLYSSAGVRDLHREGDAPEALTDLPDVPTDPRFPQDHLIRRAVVEAIESEVGEGLNIQVTVESGIVTLEGDVDDEGVKDLISETVESVPGVIAVNNVLFLEDPAVSS